jgi:hypothetical protein
MNGFASLHTKMGGDFYVPMLSAVDGNGAEKFYFFFPGEEITVITGFQVDTATKQLQVKTRKLLVIPTAPESNWITAHTGTECPS